MIRASHKAQARPASRADSAPPSPPPPRAFRAEPLHLQAADSALSGLRYPPDKQLPRLPPLPPAAAMGSFQTLTVSVADGVGSLMLNRPTKGNSISQQM